MSKLELAAMNCHHRFYPLEEFFASAVSNGYKKVELWTGINIGFASLICITGGYANYNDCCIQLCSGTIWQKKDWRENLHLRNR